MKTLGILVVCSTAVGLGLGTALAYMQVRPVAPPRKPLPPVQSGAPAPPVDNSAPRAEMPETVFEFGTIELGATRSHDFEIRNAGGAPLTIKVGSTTCKCTVGSLTTNEIPPGESTKINLEWVAKPAPGPFRHGATLVTNDPLQSQIELTVEGTIVASSFLLSPMELYYGTLQAGSEKMAAIDLLSFVDQEIEIRSHEVSENLSSQIEVQFEPLAQDQLTEADARSGIAIRANFQAGKTIGPLRGTLTLHTNFENAEKLVVPIGANVVGDISIYGAGWRAQQGLLHLGAVHSSEGKSVRLNLAVRGQYAQATEFEVGSVDPPELKVALGERRQMSDTLVHIPLVVEVPAGTPAMVRLGEPVSSDAEIVLRTTHPETPEVRLRVQFAVSQ